MKKLSYLLPMLYLFIITCTNSDNKKTSTECGTTEFVPLQNQIEGGKILQKLTKKYGQDLIENPKCPFIEGRYFDYDNYIVFQVRGDSATIRKAIEKDCGSKLFKLEIIKGKRYSQKELKEILDKMREREDTVTDEVLKENIVGSGMDAHNIFVTFIRDTPEMRQAFREKISDSPAIKFECSVRPDENNSVYPSDTLGISLRPEYSVYADTVSSVPIILLNNRTEAISCGEHYSVTYQDENGIWRNLPINGIAFDIEYCIFSKSYFRTYASLYPKINNNKPGKYRFFYNINLTPSKGTFTKIKMMTEFTLTNNYEAVKRASKLSLPKQD